MKKILPFFGILLLLMLLAAVFMLFRNNDATAPEPAPDTPGFPLTGQVPGSTEQSQGEMTVSLYDGSTAIVSDFLANPDTGKDPVNEGYYYIGYQPLGGGEPGDAPYRISYVAESSDFNITLLKEPIGEVRGEAERYLQSMLMTSPEVMCRLKYVVSVPYAVNAIYSGTNLGFSFCPGAVVLP